MAAAIPAGTLTDGVLNGGVISQRRLGDNLSTKNVRMSQKNHEESTHNPLSINLAGIAAMAVLLDLLSTNTFVKIQYKLSFLLLMVA